MKKVNKYTRAAYNGKEIFCPKCNAKNKVYHFSWCAITCGECKKMVDKYEWFLEPKKRNMKIDIMQKIHNAFNPKKEIDWGNEYKPNIKIKSTVKPNNKPTFNEISQNIYKQLKKLK